MKFRYVGKIGLLDQYYSTLLPATYWSCIPRKIIIVGTQYSSASQMEVNQTRYVTG